MALLSSPTFALQGTTATGDLSPDGYTWPQCGPVVVDQYGVVILWAQQYRSGSARNLPVVSNDGGATWSEPVRSGFFDSDGEGFVERAACAYDTVNDLLHVLWKAVDPSDGVIYRRYSLTRDGSNGITGVTRVSGVNLQLDLQTTGSMLYTHPAVLWIPEGGAHGSVLCVWAARNTGTGSDTNTNEIRASMRVLSNTTADNTAGNWVAPVTASTTGIGNAPVVAYSALAVNNTGGAAHAGIGRKASGSHAGDVYLGYYDGDGAATGLWRARRLQWNAGAADWSNGLTSLVTLSAMTVAGSDAGYVNKGELQTRWAEDAANDRMVLGFPVWLSNAAGDTQAFTWLTAADAVGALTVVYSAGGAHHFAPTMDLLVDAESGATVVTYLTSGPPDEVYLQAFDGATQIQTETVCLSDVDFDIPLLAPERVGTDSLLIVGRDAVGGTPPYDGWAGRLTWEEVSGGSPEPEPEPEPPVLSWPTSAAVTAVRERLLSEGVSPRVYRLIAPQKPTLPYVRVQLVDAPVAYHLRGPEGTTSTWVQIDAVGAESAGLVPVEALADAIQTALGGGRFAVGSPASVEVVGVFRKSRREMFEAAELRLVKVMQDFVVWTRPVH